MRLEQPGAGSTRWWMTQQSTAAFLLLLVAVSMNRADLIMGVPASILLLLAWRRSASPRLSPRAIVLGALAISVYGAIIPRPLPTTASLDGLTYLLAAGQVCAMALLIASFRYRRLIPLVLFVTVIGVTAGATFTLLETPNPSIDVALLHLDAGRVMRHGGNPYTDLDVMANGTPDFPPYRIGGYTYPPLALASFGGSASISGDGRWAGVLAVIAAAAALATLAWRNGTWEAAAIAIAFLTQPGIPLVVEAGWTETLTAALFALALLVWIRFPMVSGVLLGAALSSKQYLVLLAPLAISRPLAGRRRPIILGLSIGILPGLLAGAGAFFDAVVLSHLRLPALTQTGTIGAVLHSLGLDWQIPRVAAVCLALAVCWWLAPRASELGTLFVAAATTLLIGFALGPQTYPNYWFLGSFLLAAGAIINATGPITPVARLALTSP